MLTLEITIVSKRQSISVRLHLWGGGVKNIKLYCIFYSGPNLFLASSSSFHPKCYFAKMYIIKPINK